MRRCCAFFFKFKFKVRDMDSSSGGSGVHWMDCWNNFWNIYHAIRIKFYANENWLKSLQRTNFLMAAINEIKVHGQFEINYCQVSFLELCLSLGLALALQEAEYVCLYVLVRDGKASRLSDDLFKRLTIFSYNENAHFVNTMWQSIRICLFASVVLLLLLLLLFRFHAACRRH